MTAPTTRGPHSTRILATDDDPKMLGSLTHTLRDAGYLVYAIYNGLAAYHVATTLPGLDLLVTNTRLADLGPAELIRRVRMAKPDLPILHIGHPLPDEDGSLADVPTLQEPYTTASLLEAVGLLLRRPR